MTALEEAIAYMFLDAAEDLAHIESGLGHAGPEFQTAALAKAAAARHIPYDAYRELADTGQLGPSPHNALQAIVGLGLEGALS